MLSDLHDMKLNQHMTEGTGYNQKEETVRLQLMATGFAVGQETVQALCDVLRVCLSTCSQPGQGDQLWRLRVLSPHACRSWLQFWSYFDVHLEHQALWSEQQLF